MRLLVALVPIQISTPLQIPCQVNLVEIPGILPFTWLVGHEQAANIAAQQANLPGYAKYWLMGCADHPGAALSAFQG
jgi:hypothetical protein